MNHFSTLTRQIIILSLLIFFSQAVFALNGLSTYQAKIIKPDGQPLQSSSVNFRFTVLDPAGTCIIYIENYAAVNMADTGGLVSFSLGAGVRSYPASATSTAFSEAFDNSTPAYTCQSLSIYNPLPTDNRKVVMQFNDGAGWQTLPAMSINAVPYSMFAAKSQDSQKLNNKSDSAFVEYSTLAGLSCANDQAIKFNGVSFSCITVGAGGGGGISSVTTSGTVLTNTGTASAPVISITPVSNSTDGYLTASDYTEFKAKLSASSTQIVSTLGYTPLAATSAAVISALGYTPATSTTLANDFIQKSGDTMTGILNLPLNGLTIGSNQFVVSGGHIGIGTTSPMAALDVSGAIRISYEANCSVSYAGTIRYSGGALEYCNGTSWNQLGVSGSGLTLLNGSASNTQSFANGYSGTAPLFNTTNGVHSLNIPLASAGAVTAGLISNADYLNFSTVIGKITSSAASIAQVLGFTPADTVSVTTLSSSIDSVSAAVSSLNTNTAASFAAITSSQWNTSGTTINYLAGNVGIGTSAVSSMVHVKGADPDITLEFNNAPTAALAEIRFANDSYIGAQMSYHRITNDLRLVYDGGATGSGTFSINRHGNSRFFITNAGEVGIGTATPTAKLQLAAGTSQTASLKITSGTLLSSPADGAIEYDGTSLYYTDATNTRRALASNNGSQTNSGNNTYTGINTFSGQTNVSNSTASTNSTTGAFVVSGGVGIGGSVNIAGQLNVLGGISTSGVITPYIYGSTAVSGNLVLESTTNAVKGNILLAPNGGNVGIGTLSPISKLHLQDISGSVPLYLGTATGLITDSLFMNVNGRAGFGYDGARQAVYIGDGVVSATATKPIVFDTVGVERLRIGINGNVGIGTSSPTHKLDVFGDSTRLDKYLILRDFDGDATDSRMISRNSNTQFFTGGVVVGNYTNGAVSAVGTGNMVVAGNVGIGTLTPLDLLHISGSGTVSSRIETTNAGRAIQSFMRNGSYVWDHGVNTNNLGTNDYQIREDGSSVRLVIQDSTGNVGIGASSPMYALDIVPSSSASSFIQIRSPGGANNKFGLSLGVGANQASFLADPASGNGVRISRLNTGPLVFGQNDNVIYPGQSFTEQMRLDTSGNVGIGTINPTAKLDVNGAIRATSFSTNSQISRSSSVSAGNTPYWIQVATLPISTAGTGDMLNVEYFGGGAGSDDKFHESLQIANRDGLNVYTYESKGNLGWKAHARLQAYNNGSGLVTLYLYYPGTSFAHAGVNITAASWGTGPTLYANEAQSTTAPTGSLVYDSSNTNGSVHITNSGNVGIGTTTPTGPFEVSATTNSLAYFRSSGSNSAGVFIDNSTGGFQSAVYLRDAGVTKWQVGKQADNTFIVYDATLLRSPIRTSTSGDLLFQSVGGNVGIGTSAPAFALSVVRSGVSTGAVINASTFSSAAPTDRSIFLTERARGTETSPSSVLNGDTIGSFQSNAFSGSSYFGITSLESSIDGSFTAGQRPPGRMTFNTATANGAFSERMRIDSLGNVGIGTSSPSTTLQVSGTIRVETADINGTTLSLKNTGASGRDWMMISAGAISGVPGSFIIYDPLTSASRFVIRSNGDIGIGTSSPGYKLDVSGTVNIASGSALRFGGTQICTSAGCTSTSDMRLKENIQPLDFSLEKLLSLKGYHYDWKDKAKYGSSHQVGLLAQELEKVYPEVVITDSETGMKSVAYGHLIAPVIEALKTLYFKTINVQRDVAAVVVENKRLSENDKAKDEKIKQLENENNEIKARLERLEKKLNEQK